MSVVLTQDPASPVGALDQAFGVAGNALDLWSKWTTTKTANVKDKAEISSQVLKDNAKATTNGTALNPQTLLIVGGAGVALLLGLTLLRRK